MKKSQLETMDELPFADKTNEYKEAVIEHVTKKVGQGKYQTSESFIGWMGGKSRMAKELIAMMPPHKVYVEAFMGSAAVFFAKPKVETNILNDKNSLLVNLFTILADAELSREFFFQIFHMLNSKEMFNYYRKWIKPIAGGKATAYPEQLAAVYFYLIQQNFNNNLMAGWSHKEGITTNVFYKLIKAREKLDGVIIENMDFLKLIKKYNTKQEVMFFLDPPYVVTDDGRYYEHSFKKLDHLRLANVCKEIHKAGNTFIITYDNVKEIREMYKDFDIRSVNLLYTSMKGENERREEIVIHNIEKFHQLSMF